MNYPTIVERNRPKNVIYGSRIFGVVKMIDISEAKSIIKAVKKALDELQTSGWTVEITNESRSIYLSSGEITIKARPTKPIILEAREGYKGYC